MIKFDKNDVLRLYKKVVDYTGGTFGIRDETMLESALAAPYQTFAGEELYPPIIKKAARLGYGLVRNHPFIDGNKRIGIFVMLVFLSVNNINIEFNDAEIIKMGLDTANGKCDYDDILNIIETKKKTFSQEK